MIKIHGTSDVTSMMNSVDPPPDGAEMAGFAASGAMSADVGAAAARQALYLTEAGDTSSISLNDIHQGQIGDCFLLSPIGEIAMLRPTFISNMIHTNADGTETVTLYKSANGSLPNWNTTSFKAVTETVSNVFPTYAVNNGAAQDLVAGVKEIWPQVLENAMAQLNGGYGGIAYGGSPVLAMEELTGKTATAISPRSVTQALLQALSAQGEMIVMDTVSGGNLPNGLVANHAYMYEGTSGTGAGATVRLGNPWGMDQPAPILLSQLSKGIAEVDIGRMV